MATKFDNLSAILSWETKLESKRWRDAWGRSQNPAWGQRFWCCETSYFLPYEFQNLKRFANLLTYKFYKILLNVWLLIAHMHEWQLRTCMVKHCVSIFRVGHAMACGMDHDQKLLHCSTDLIRGAQSYHGNGGNCNNALKQDRELW